MTATRAEIKRAFELVLERFKANPRAEFICNHLVYIGAERKVTPAVAAEAQELIQTRLRPRVTLDDWLGDQGIPDYRVHGYSSPESPRAVKMHATRVAWLESLIKEFS